MKWVSWFVLALMLALAGSVSEAHAVRPPQHVAPTPAPSTGGQRGDDDLPSKQSGLKVADRMHVPARSEAVHAEESRRAQPYEQRHRDGLMRVITVTSWITSFSRR